MKVCLGLLVALILGMGVMTRMEAGEGEARKGHMRKRLWSALNLSETQQQELQAQRAEFKQTLRDIRGQVEAGSLTPEEGRAQVQTTRQAHGAARDEILTEEQKALLERTKKHIKKRAGLLKALDLSAEQEAQLRELRQQSREQRQQWRASDQPPSPEERERFRREHREAFEAILTDAQRDELTALRQARHDRRRAGDQEPGSGALEILEDLLEETE